MAHVNDKKKQVVKEFKELVSKYPVVAVVNMANIPARQLQKMREKLRAKNTVLRMTKKRLMKIVFKDTDKKDIEKLEQHFKGMPALVFSEQNPFSLYAELQKTKSRAPAKAGQQAPKDIVVTAGPTSFSPGPIIGQLGKFGIKSGIENGKIVIKSDAVVAKEGKIISAELAGILSRLGVEPMEIGLDLTAAYENGTIFTADILYVDEKEYLSKFIASHSEAVNLAVYAGWINETTGNMVIGKAVMEARSLSIETGYVTADTAEQILQRAQGQMMSLALSLPEGARPSGIQTQTIAPQAKAQEEPKEQKPKEEPKQDAAAGLGALFG